MNGLIDTYQLSTCGQNSIDTYTRSSNGILISVYIDVLPPELPIGNGGYLVKGLSRNLRRKEREKEREGEQKKDKEEEIEERKQITVIALINGKEYIETLIVKNKPNLTVNDVDVDITSPDNEPKIKITVKF